MKKTPLYSLIFLVTLTLSCTNTSHAQLPEVVKTSFKAKYPNEKPNDWEIDAHGNYEFHFKKNGEKHRADFLANGIWIETEISIKKKHLPKAIRKIIKQKYKNKRITEIEKVMHHSKGLFYDVEFKRKGKNKDVEFKADGTIIN